MRVILYQNLFSKETRNPFWDRRFSQTNATSDMSEKYKYIHKMRKKVLYTHECFLSFELLSSENKEKQSLPKFSWTLYYSHVYRPHDEVNLLSVAFCKQFAYREKNNAVVVRTKFNHLNIYEELFSSNR